MPLTFEGGGLDEVGRDSDGKVRIRVAPEYFRPAEVDVLRSNPQKAREAFGWAPSVSFEELVRIMVRADVDAVKTGKVVSPRGSG